MPQLGIGASGNFDLLSVGIAVAGIGVLGFSVFFNNRKSVTNRSFLYFSLVTIAWSVTNYFAYQIKDPQISLWLFRIVIAFGAWHAFTFFRLAYSFPREQVSFPQLYRTTLIPLVAIVSILNLTPLVFSHVAEVSPGGEIMKIENGPVIPLFGTLVGFLVITGIILLIRKTVKAKEKIEKRQFGFILLGVIMTFLLLMAFNFILPAFFDNPRFIPLGALFIFPFVAFSSYAIIKHHLFDIKVVTTELLTFALALATFFEVLISSDPYILVFRSAVFFLVLVFGIFLIKSVFREVEQREQLQKLSEELKVKNVQLDELSHFKSQLLQLASHQVKSPLAAIKGFVSLVLDNTGNAYGEISEKTRETLGKVKKSADGLVALINTLLDLRKVEEGKMDYEFAPADLLEIVSGVVEELKPLAAQKNLEFTLTAPPEKIIVNADATKLKQVIQNITDNAIKYTQAGYVKVAVEKKENAVVVSVRDSGYGVPADLLSHLFEEFVRDEKVKQKILGTGLGLYIARKIMEAHGGKIWAESDGEGKGTTFFVALQQKTDTNS